MTPAHGAGTGVSGRGPGREFFAPRARDDARALPVLGNAPPILFSLSCQRKENAPCTVEEKREALLVPSGVFSIHRQHGGQRCVDVRTFAPLPALRAWLAPVRDRESVCRR